MVLRKLKNLLSNESGNFAIIFAISAFPIIGTVALAVDYSAMSQDRSVLQNALDAAALATAKQYAAGTNGTALETYAKDYILANISPEFDADDIAADVDIIDVEETNPDGTTSTFKAVKLDLDYRYNSFVAQVMSHDYFDLGISAQVAMGNITVEVAMVFDNSGSMNGNRLTLAKSTGKQMVDTVFQAASGSNKPNPVSFSIVPFAASVNIGTNNVNKNWMDKRGRSPVHHENLNWATYITPNQTRWNGSEFQEKINNVWTPKTRHDIFSMVDQSWGGCVEMRPWPHNTLDTVAYTAGTPVGGTGAGTNASADIRSRLFVPMMAPAEPGQRLIDTLSGQTITDTDDDHYNYSNDWLSNIGNTSGIYDYRSINTAGSTFWFDDAVVASSTGAGVNINPKNFDGGQNQRQNWIWRYQAAKADNKLGNASKINDGCTTMALKELSTDKEAIKTSIDAMWARGNTNVHEGVAWGWRTLSKSDPFTAGRDSSDIENRKYMIVLTDGNNTYGDNNSPNGSTYAAWGFEKHGRIDQGLTTADLAGTIYAGQTLNTWEKKMNAHGLQTCANAKADGITIFTIAFDVSNGSSVKQMLNACSGSGVVDGLELAAGGQFYFDVSGTELQGAMEAIASQISELRILK